MKKPYVPLLARCVIAAGNANAGQLLYRINFWMQYAKVEYNGRKFSANSAQRWCQETGLSIDQYRRAITRLRKLGFVETEQHLFGNKNITHVRITDAGRQAIGAASSSLGQIPSPGLSNCEPDEKGADAQLYIKGDTYMELHQGVSEQPFASAHDVCSFNQEGEELSGEVSKSKQKPTASDGLGEAQSSTDPIYLTPLKLAELWVNLVQKHYPQYIPPMTSKVLAQFKQITLACPPGLAAGVIEACIKDWNYFTKTAKERSGAYSLPQNPTVGFLLKWVGDAIHFTQLQKAQVIPVKKSKQSMPVALPKPMADAEVHPTSKEELLDILSDD